uniref:Uncharacterized protein n=1 Tax=Romanomermis culicivorax TaxID=13658 RepID=A0A915IXW2_ROMCU
MRTVLKKIYDAKKGGSFGSQDQLTGFLNCLLIFLIVGTKLMASSIPGNELTRSCITAFPTLKTSSKRIEIRKRLKISIKTMNLNVLSVPSAYVFAQLYPSLYYKTPILTKQKCVKYNKDRSQKKRT